MNEMDNDAIMFRGQQIFELGRRDASGTWFTYADIDRIGAQLWCANLPMGPWLARIIRPGQPYRERRVSTDDAQAIMHAFAQLRASRGLRS